jgi:hypothetical protein
LMLVCKSRLWRRRQRGADRGERRVEAGAHEVNRDNDHD